MYQISPLEGNVVRNLQPISANIITVNLRPKQPASNYTSQNKRKATEGDPIRSIEDIQLIKEYFHSTNLRNYLLFVLGISIGIRGKDLLRLQVRDVVNCNGYILDEIATFESKTHKMNHPIINDEAKAAIAEYLATFETVSPTDYLFRVSPTNNTPIKPDSLYKILVRTKQKLADKLTVNFNFNVRTLRKTFAYWVIKQHYNDPHVMASLQEMLNHDSMLTTLHYSGHTREHLTTMYNDMGDVISGKAVVDTPAADSVESKLDMILSLMMPAAE